MDYSRDTYLILAQADELDDALTALRAIGVDRIAGFATATAIGAGEARLTTVTAQEVAARLPQNGLQILDVRGRQEYRDEHIIGAINIPLGYLPKHLDELPQASTLVVHCTSGYRSQIGVSYLRAQGMTNVVNLDSTQAEWSEALPTESGS